MPGGAGNLNALVQSVRWTPGVSSVEAVPESDMRETLGRWLGPAAQSAELPVPALVDFDASRARTFPRFSNAPARSLRARASSPTATASSPLLHSLRLVAMGRVRPGVAAERRRLAAVVLAARGALDTHRFTIEVMHGIGATDLQVTHLFQRKLLIDALVGSLAGALAAAVVLLLLASGAALAGELTGGATLGPLDLVVLAALPFALTVLATWVARTAVLRSLRKAL